MKQSNLKKLLKKQEKLTQEFTVELGFYPTFAIDYNHYKWSHDDESVTWYKPDEYSEEAIIISEEEDVTLFLIYGSSGDKWYCAFDNSKRIK